MNIEYRVRMEINTDPQRRCYYGCHAKSELVWTPWVVLEYDIAESKIDRRLAFWKELNDYAVSQRGESARREFRVAHDKPVRGEEHGTDIESDPN